MSRENVELIVRAHRLSRTNPESFFSVCDPDIEWDMSGLMPDGRVYRGHQGVREFWRGWTGTWEGFDFEVVEAVDAGDEVVAKVHQVGRGRGSGAPVQLTSGQVWTVRDGRIVRFRAFRTFADALEAVGLEE
jgi:ketosteroid isomerase-like protein